MIGFFDENIKTIKETIAFCKKNKIEFPFFFMIPYPDT